MSLQGLGSDDLEFEMERFVFEDSNSGSANMKQFSAMNLIVKVINLICCGIMLLSAGLRSWDQKEDPA